MANAEVLARKPFNEKSKQPVIESDLAKKRITNEVRKQAYWA